ncbi:MAG: hypothetical protein HYS57_03125 [Parcubacteria group bacterium]|nr:hypothetical protein [Parcubacteria group bacterium]
MRKLMLVVAIVVAATISVPAMAQNQPATNPTDGLIFAVGVKTGTYNAFYRNMGDVCGKAAVKMYELASTGSVDNLDMLLGKKVHVAFLQLDALYAAKDVEKNSLVDTTRILMVLYPEEVHIITHVKSGINTFADLQQGGRKKVRRVGVWGGSVFTAKVVFAKTGVAPTEVFEYKPDLGPDGKVSKSAQIKAVEDLKTGRIQAILAVGGAPLSWVRDLDQSFKIVPFDDAKVRVLIDDVGYIKASLGYTNLTDSSGVNSVAVHSLLVTRNFKSQPTVGWLDKFRDCVVGNLQVLQEGLGYHPKWQAVDPNRKVQWAYFNGR